VTFLTNLCRFLLAGVFVFSGLVKANEIIGTQYKIQEYFVAFGWNDAIRSDIPLYFAIMLCVVEFVLGIHLLFGVWKRLTTNITCLLLAYFTAITFWIAIDNKISDCGCFGEVLTLSNWQSFFKNVILLIAAFFITTNTKSLKPLFHPRMAWFTTIWSLVSIVSLIVYSSRHLPLIDTSDYRIGTDLNLIDLPMHNFYLYSTDEETDMTDSIVGDKNYTFLMISNQLSLASDDDIDLINELYDYCKAKNYGFYAVTASTAVDKDRWEKQTGADYPFLESDDTMLRTLIRANPGLLLLKDGVIIEKFGLVDWPDLSAYPSTIELQAEMIHNKKLSWIKALGWYLLPFALIFLLGWRNKLKTNKNNPKKEKK